MQVRSSQGESSASARGSGSPASRSATHIATAKPAAGRVPAHDDPARVAARPRRAARGTQRVASSSAAGNGVLGREPVLGQDRDCAGRPREPRRKLGMRPRRSRRRSRRRGGRRGTSSPAPGGVEADARHATEVDLGALDVVGQRERSARARPGASRRSSIVRVAGSDERCWAKSSSVICSSSALLIARKVPCPPWPSHFWPSMPPPSSTARSTRCPTRSRTRRASRSTRSSARPTWFSPRSRSTTRARSSCASAPKRRPTARRLLPAYHADRPEMPEKLVPQWERAKSFFEGFDWTVRRHATLEADDLLGTLADLETEGRRRRAAPDRRPRHVPVRFEAGDRPLPADREARRPADRAEGGEGALRHRA